MDEMKLKISSGVMKDFVSKMIAKAICKKLGFRISIQLKDLDVNIIDGETKLLTTAEIRLDRQGFRKLIKLFHTD